MNSSRLSQLLDFLKNDPKDAFTLYAIATEYKSTDPQEALKYFEILLQEHPDYLATYYHVAHLYLELEEDEKAEAAFKKGIELAQKQENALSLRELQNAYNEFLFED
ncbi:tetratricopeptide repeat protein [Fulvivirga sp. RKSG066]|uniref:tetratricopeptide repeat protein n=1 Tax=Fulvivirga aurantia TaxID=2529383 RepID=UPI0012BBC6A3|nr:tetratricopeptide repeat protein [Fulvivirga aurantia]MTI19921.1 tetratricopeptide repeat protein [Fulvivirga aurantia]